MRPVKNKPRPDFPEKKRNPLYRARLEAGMTQEAAVEKYRKVIGPLSLRTWQLWERKPATEIPHGALLVFKGR